MPHDGLIVGLDIGTTKVCACIAETNDNGILEVIGVGTAPSQGLRRGVVINIESTLKSVAAAIEAAELMSGREVESVITGIAGAHIEGINSRGVVAVSGRDREISSEDIARVIEAAKAIVIPMDREVLHVIPQEFIVDDQRGIKDPLDMIGIRLEAEVHIVTGSVTSAQNLLKCVNRAGFRVSEIVLESLAASRAVLTEDEKELGVLLIDLGGGTTDVLVHLDGAPYHTDVVALGGSQVTNDISIILKTPLDVAERIKKESGCCYLPLVDKDERVMIPGVGGWPAATIPRQELVKIIQPRMAEIFSMVRDQLEKKDYMRHLGGGVVLTGGGALIPGAAELALEVFGIPARIGIPDKLRGLVEEYQNPVYATAMGLVLYGSEGVSVTEGGIGRRKGEGLMSRLKGWMKEFF
ncbi:cell division protein FtsA [Marispirochaeta aestuarii]|uniref:Cell division protein FtsA n=1 Tax=Marispirochaeta aestuarii TaxID=1963862 RepID=A0A1Y1RW62_9SPIO|nr:cell division protein FtsA [Marispirochaeta aestuarii]ORC34319.1 cell division protein FtsA [Marispirochaeta aestuarii]